jgi:integrase
MAWTRKAPNGKVKGCWRDHTGKERSRTFATKTEALKYAKKQEVAIDSGIRRDHDLGKMNLGTWMQEWMDTSPSHRAGTKSVIESKIRLHILPTALARIPLYKITPLDFDRWVADRVKAGVGAATIDRTHQMLSAALTRAVDREIIPRNPVRRASLPEYMPEVKVVLNADQVVALSEAVERRYSALILVLGFGGVRIQEAAALALKDFDEAQGYLWITRQLHTQPLPYHWGLPKTPNRLKAPAMLPDFVVQAVREHIDAGLTSTFDGETLIFSAKPTSGDSPDHGGPGGPLSKVTAWNVVKRGGRKIGLPPAFRTHNLRDSCATNMLANGASVQDVADQLGDDPKTVLDTYVHSSPESRRAALSRMATRALAGSPEVLQLPAPIIEGELIED